MSSESSEANPKTPPKLTVFLESLPDSVATSKEPDVPSEDPVTPATPPPPPRPVKHPGENVLGQWDCRFFMHQTAVAGLTGGWGGRGPNYLKLIENNATGEKHIVVYSKGTYRIMHNHKLRGEDRLLSTFDSLPESVLLLDEIGGDDPTIENRVAGMQLGNQFVAIVFNQQVALIEFYKWIIVDRLRSNESKEPASTTVMDFTNAVAALPNTKPLTPLTGEHDINGVERRIWAVGFKDTHKILFVYSTEMEISDWLPAAIQPVQITAVSGIHIDDLRRRDPKDVFTAAVKKR